MNIENILNIMRTRHHGGYQALLTHLIFKIRQYWEEQGRSVLLVPLSGGIDSTVVTALLVHAVGIDHVYPITMPARKDDPSVAAFELVRDWLGFPRKGIHGSYERDITNVVDYFATMFGIETNENMRRGNAGSRLRIATICDIKRLLDGRIAGCYNRTEWLLGHATQFGTPLSCDLAPIAHLYKCDIYELGKLLGVPEPIMAATPSTGFFEGQTHEEDVGVSLELQDVLLYLLVENGMTPEEIHRCYGIKLENVQRIYSKWIGSAFKRNPPVSFGE